MSLDGKIALADGRQLRISSDEDIVRVHRLRNMCDAVLVGVGTVLMDDPKLTVKEDYVDVVRQPLRVILDTHLRTPLEAEVMSEAASTLIATGGPSFKRDNVEAVKCGDGRVELSRVLSLLDKRGVERVLVEGGETVIYSFLQAHLVDVLTVYVAPIVIGGTGTPTMAGGPGATAVGHIIGLSFDTVERLGDGVLLTLHPSVSNDLDEE
jgi:2,5-diamino-6-(ribosylamino)-4(3H)-pyrimidinone 5'-phosphate reductase